MASEKQSNHEQKKPDSHLPKYSDPASQAEYARLAEERRALDATAGNVESRESLGALRHGGTGQSWMRYSGLGIQMAAGLVLPVLGGMYADNNWGWSPWGVIGGATLGGIVSMYSVIAAVSRGEKADAKAAAREAAAKQEAGRD